MRAIPVECPVTYYEKNMLFNTDRKCWAVYKLVGFNYDFKSAAAKIDTLSRLVEVLKNLVVAKLLIIPTTEPVEVHADKIRRDILAKNQNDPLQDEAVNYLELTCQYLNSLNSDFWKDFTCYLVVRIQPESVSEFDLTLQELLKIMQAPIFSLTAFLGLNDNEIPVETYKRYLKLETDAYKLLCGCIDLKRVTQSELQWLLKRPMLRGTGKAPKLNRAVKTSTEDKRWYKHYTTDWSPGTESGKLGSVEYYRPNKADVANMFEGRLCYDGNKGITVTHADGIVSYQSFVMLTGIPDALQFPGCEWIYKLQQLPVQLEICIDIENINNKKARDELNNKDTEISTQYESVVNAGARVPAALYDAQAQLDTLRQELEDNKLPMSSVRISICVAGATAEQVERDIKLLTGALTEMDFVTARPIADQLRLFYQHLPGTESYARAFTRKMSPFMLACGIFGASSSVGDDVGYYIGSANDKPVYLRLGLACLRDNSPAATMYGGLGQGKSLSADILMFLHVLFGAYGLVICPKGERATWGQMPILGSYVNLVEFSTDPKNKGKLDPYNIFRGNINEATDLATNILTDLLEIAPKSDEYIIMLECLNRVAEKVLPSMEALMVEIDSVPKSDIYYLAAQKLHRTLQALRGNGIVRLFFGNGREEAIDINGRLNVIMFNGITLPDKNTDKKNYKADEKNAMLLLSVVSSISKKFAHLHPGREKLTLIDESWALTATTSGSALIEYHGRLGRSLFHDLILNGHSVLDLPSEQMRNTITYKFCFNPRDEKEALRMLEYMRLEPTNENVNALMTLSQGECLFTDLYGRTAKLHFDPVFDDIFEFFKTTPTPDDDRKSSTPVKQQGEPEEQDEATMSEIPQLDSAPLVVQMSDDGVDDDELNAMLNRLLGEEISA